MIDLSAIKFKWLCDLPQDQRCVGIASWRGELIIATDAGNIYVLEHDELADQHRLRKVAS